jgi:heme/copper-type cytochrome/quinol oxidase subunit 2
MHPLFLQPPCLTPLFALVLLVLARCSRLINTNSNCPGEIRPPPAADRIIMIIIIIIIITTIIIIIMVMVSRSSSASSWRKPWR